MNDLEQLRSTLDRHAEAVSGGEAHVRIAAVRHRVRSVRNRRRAAAAGGAVAVLAVVGGVAALPDGDPAADPASKIVGVQAPAEMTSLGFTYELADGIEGTDGTAVLKLRASDEPRLVSWATSGDDDAVRVSSPVLGAPVRFTDADFTNWTVVPEGYDATVRAVAEEGEPGLAVYSLADDQRPSGITKDGVTFRDEVPGGRLIDAQIGEPGQSEVSVSGVSTGQGVTYAYYCTGGPKDAYLHVSGVVGSGGCDDTLPTDAAAAGGVSFALEAGEAFDNRLYVTAGEKGPRVDDPDLRIGLGVYALDRYEGTNDYLPRTREIVGHVWERVEVQRGETGSDSLGATAPRGRGAVLAVAAMGSRAGSVSVDFGDSPTGYFSQYGGSTQEVVDAGETVTMASDRGGRADPSTFRVGFYVRAD